MVADTLRGVLGYPVWAAVLGTRGPLVASRPPPTRGQRHRPPVCSRGQLSLWEADHSPSSRGQCHPAKAPKQAHCPACSAGDQQGHGPGQGRPTLGQPSRRGLMGSKGWGRPRRTEGPIPGRGAPGQSGARVWSRKSPWLGRGDGRGLCSLVTPCTRPQSAGSAGCTGGQCLPKSGSPQNLRIDVDTGSFACDQSRIFS